MSKDWTCDKCKSTKFNSKFDHIVCRKCRTIFEPALHPDQILMVHNGKEIKPGVWQVVGELNGSI